MIIYPFRQPRNLDDLEALYDLVARLDDNREVYARPITVMDRKTYFAAEGNRAFQKFRDGTVARRSDILDAWCVDTCQMWYTGLGQAFERGGEGDVYWLIPGDFDYGRGEGHLTLGKLHDLPEIVAELDQDVCVGEIATQPTHSKQLIDTYGTFALLYNWFPKEAAELRETVERPRSEFFALRHDFMREVLRERWYAYEQTVVLLLRAISSRRRVSRFSVGHLSDLPEGRESLSAAVQQVERMERVLKTHWRESHQSISGWAERYRVLDAQSEQIRRTAHAVLQNLLK